MKITKKKLRELIIEELTAADKAEVKSLAAKEVEKAMKSRDVKDMIEKMN